MPSTLLAQLQLDHGLWLDPWTGRWIAETICSMLVGITCGVLGCFVVLRRMALIGDALSHAVLPGVVVAFMISGSVGPMGLLIGALIAGLLTAVCINLVGKFSRTKEDSAIGIVFTALFAVGIILISNLPRGTHFDLKCFLFGDPLAVSSPDWPNLLTGGYLTGLGRFAATDIGMMALICPVVLATVALLYHRLKLVSFDPLVAAAMGVSVAAVHYLLMGMLSATIVAGLKTTGVILVVAMVITPASAAYQLTNRFWAMLVLAGAFGGLSAGVGMSLAFVSNSPTGPAMVLVAVAIFIVAVLGSPNHGVVLDKLRRRKLARHVINEDVLKTLFRVGPVPTTGYEPALVTEIHLGPRAIAAAIRRLTHEQLLTEHNGHFDLTDAGRHHARELVRAHRLWETYLTEKAGVDPDQVHAEAERLEHAHDLTEQLDASLNHPTTDPHGSTIPPPDPRK